MPEERQMLKNAMAGNAEETLHVGAIQGLYKDDIDSDIVFYIGL